jgi:hypothetical protein
MNYSDRVRKMLLENISLDSKDLYIQSKSKEALTEHLQRIQDRRRLHRYVSKDSRSGVYYQNDFSESTHTNPKNDLSKKVSIMNDSEKVAGKPKFMRYNTNFSRLLRLVLNMSENEQLRLLEYAKSIIDERNLPRNSCLIPTNCTFKDRTFDGYILDINSYGAYVDTDEPCPIGQEIYLSFFNPFSYKHMDLDGKIIWSSTQGIGVSFNDLSRASYIW